MGMGHGAWGGACVYRCVRVELSPLTGRECRIVALRGGSTQCNIVLRLAVVRQQREVASLRVDVLKT